MSQTGGGSLKTAELSECPEGEVYQPKLQECRATAPEPQIMELDVVGRNARIGALYDHRSAQNTPRG